MKMQGDRCWCSKAVYIRVRQCCWQTDRRVFRCFQLRWEHFTPTERWPHTHLSSPFSVCEMFSAELEASQYPSVCPSAALSHYMWFLIYAGNIESVCASDDDYDVIRTEAYMLLHPTDISDACVCVCLISEISGIRVILSDTLLITYTHSHTLTCGEQWIM